MSSGHQLPRRGPSASVGEQRRGGRAHHRGFDGLRGDAQIQLPLGVIGQQPLSLLDEQPELGLIAGRAHMADDAAATIDRFGDLDRRGTRGRAHPPNPHHQPSLPSAN